jgi:hypothetical protein
MFLRNAVNPSEHNDPGIQPILARLPVVKVSLRPVSINLSHNHLIAYLRVIALAKAKAHYLRRPSERRNNYVLTVSWRNTRRR